MAKNIDLSYDDNNENINNNSQFDNNSHQQNTNFGQANSSGLTLEEESDPNKIKVVISDPSPIIILFGARGSGKTMTLIRLTRWLKKNGFKVEPVRDFRPSNSEHYKKMCNNFDVLVNSDYAVDSTHILSFMLVKVMNKYGEPICQLLEAPGEHYFDERFPKKPFPRYINAIKELDNPKTWMFFVELDWLNASDRSNYADKIIHMQSGIEKKDRVIFTCQKSDQHQALYSAGVPNETQFFKNVFNQYQGIFSKYQNNNLVTKIYRKYNFDFVIFSSGIFNETTDGGQAYTPSNDKYPTNLWNSIMKTVKGGW